ncbi:hypothetical protein WN51_09787 [Melipona quadrifasciata]|uniref:Uncharacterized protein n=1 Tax=Melipona quadrifasciata TaxID=166423 RepID=A0A0M9A7E7_9HYME|nr:hypothetical protein WN51_09787 [Melipona quadrifasciata]
MYHYYILVMKSEALEFCYYCISFLCHAKSILTSSLIQDTIKASRSSCIKYLGTPEFAWQANQLGGSYNNLSDLILKCKAIFRLSTDYLTNREYYHKLILEIILQLADSNDFMKDHLSQRQLNF